MRVEVRVVPRAKQPSLSTALDGTLVAKVTAPPDDGRANAAVIALLAEQFHVPRQAVTIVRGRTSRRKLVEIA